MRHQAFLLGLFATGSQTLILRELVSTLNGSELFIGTALFGWLVWVAMGAYLGGELSHPLNSKVLFITGAIALPVLIALCRFMPLLVTDTIGELIPFSVASLLSIVVTLPHGVLSGMLFPAIARGGESEDSTILRVYLIEGLGACAAGVGVTLIAGYWLSTLATGLLLAVVVAISSLIEIRRWRLTVAATTVAMAGILLISGAVGRIERSFDRARYPGYEVVGSFDTPYTHQAILKRDSAIVLMTDNTVEATYPDVETAENLLLPAIAYLDAPVQAFVAGRTEFGIAQLADSVGGMEILCVDPRKDIGGAVGAFKLGSSVPRVSQDIIQYLSPQLLSGEQSRPNAAIVALGDLSSGRTARLVCDETLRKFAHLVQDSGLLIILTRFDTDRYVTPLVGEILGTIWTELAATFSYVSTWPGTSTLFLASNSRLFDISKDTLFARLSRMTYQPQFVHEMYLRDRLNDFKVAGLVKELNSSFGSHTIDKPTLVMKQALYRAKAHAIDRLLTSAIFEHSVWLLIFPAAMLGLLSFSFVVADRRRTFGLPLYVSAGFISFVVELLIFYLYQANVGSLHAELAALVGVFMFGLACGTCLGAKRSSAVVERVSLTLLATSIVALLFWNSVWPTFFAPYSFALMFLTAFGTGGLFVAATRRYYRGRDQGNRGLGYAVEISGSAVGALLTTTVLLPTIGLSWILVSCLILIGLTGLASLMVPPAT